MPVIEPLPRLLTIDQLAERLGVTPRHVRRLVFERRVPFLKVGRFVRFSPNDIAKWLQSTRREPRIGRDPGPLAVAVTGGSYVVASRPSAQLPRRYS